MPLRRLYLSLAVALCVCTFFLSPVFAPKYAPPVQIQEYPARPHRKQAPQE